MKKLAVHFTCLLLFCLIGFTLLSSTTVESPTTSQWNHVVDYAQTYLPKYGRLVTAKDGYSYLKVDDRYIHALFPRLDVKKYGFEKPPYFRRKNSPGSHISVIYADENVIPDEEGQYFRFQLKEITVIQASKDTSYIILVVNAPELEKLREKYGLGPKLQGHEFHISIAKRVVHPRPH